MLLLDTFYPLQASPAFPIPLCLGLKWSDEAFNSLTDCVRLRTSEIVTADITAIILTKQPPALLQINRGEFPLVAKIGAPTLKKKHRSLLTLSLSVVYQSNDLKKRGKKLLIKTALCSFYDFFLFTIYCANLSDLVRLKIEKKNCSIGTESRFIGMTYIYINFFFFFFFFFFFLLSFYDILINLGQRP